MSPSHETESHGEPRVHGLQRLVTAVKALSHARSIEQIAVIVRQAARELNGADGATFVLREGDNCYYFDEDAIEPLWKGRRFPLESCISGWSMIHGEAVAIADIYADTRIPHEAYRPTFVKSLVMVPVRGDAPVAAIGTYWATDRAASAEEIELVQALADSTSVALENVRVYAELEQRVHERTAQLEAANRDLDAFSYSVSHDLRNPVGAVMGFVTLLRKELAGGSPKARKYVENIAAASERMNTLIDDLLSLSRAARATPVRTQVDLSALAGTIAREIQEAWPAAEVRVEPDLMVMADLTLLRVVLENLLSNAFKYSSKKDHPKIEVGCAQHEAGLAFFVRDNGAGFDPRLAVRLFKPFERLHSDDDFPGNGVGLATCERIVTRHGGKIWAVSELGEGATFHFTLPATQ